MVSEVHPPPGGDEIRRGPTTARARRRVDRLIDGVLWALAALPGLALMLLGSMVLRVRLVDGAWPAPNQPDPKELGWHNLVTGLAVVASFLAVFVVPALTAAAFARGHRRVVIGPLVASVVLTVALALVLWGDPGSVGQWFAD